MVPGDGSGEGRSAAFIPSPRFYRSTNPGGDGDRTFRSPLESSRQANPLPIIPPPARDNMKDILANSFQRREEIGILPGYKQSDW